MKFDRAKIARWHHRRVRLPVNRWAVMTAVPAVAQTGSFHRRHNSTIWSCHRHNHGRIINGKRISSMRWQVLLSWVHPLKPDILLKITYTLQKYAVGTNEMATMTQIHLLLSSTMFGLHRLNVFLPSLTVLNLDGSSLDSLRDLGSELNIKYLNVSRCGLRSLDGINGMHLVEQLVADINKIENVLPLSNLSELQCLSLKGFVLHWSCATFSLICTKLFRCRNRIKGREALSCLSLCVRLVELRLQDNPIAKPVGYRQFVGSIVPNLLIVDGMSVGGNKSIFADQNDLAELSSSVSSSLSRDIDTTNSSNNNSLHEIDPLSSIERNSETVLLTRPSKAGDALNDNSILTFNFHAHIHLSQQIHSAMRIVRYAIVMRLSAI